MKLQYKILLIFFSLALLLGAPLLLTVKSMMHQILLQDVERRGILRASDLAEEAVAGFQGRSEAQLLPQLQTARERTGALYALALSSTGEVLAHTDVTEKGKTYDDALTRQSLQAPSATTRISQQKGNQVMDVSVPVWATRRTPTPEEFLIGGGHDLPEKIRLGNVQLGLPLDEILEIQYRLFTKIAAIVLLTGLIGLSLIVFFMRRILRPIKFLSEATSRISQGEYGIDVPVSSKDELGRLAGDFNRMRRALAETTVSKDYLSGVLDNLVDPLIVTAPDTTIRDINPAALYLLGYTLNNLIGQPLDILYPEPGSPLKTAENDERLRHSILRNVEMHWCTKQGEQIPVLLSSSVFKDASGRVSDIIVTVRDMTERKRLEGILRQSDKMSAVGQLAAGVAHEINNPLGVILGFVEAMDQDMDAANPLSEPIKSIIRETLRCKNLVQNLLTFSRERQPGMRAEDPEAVVNNALSLVETQARVKNIHVVRNYAAPLPPVEMDRNQIEQVIINLSTNAMDSMPNGGQLTVSLVPLESGLEIQVNDTGTGIPEAIQQKIFEPFFSTKEIGKGTGLGLSIVYDTVKKHQGTIDVQSEAGRGTTFIVRLPLRTTPVEGAVDD